MSAPFTFATAKTRFAGLVTTKIQVGDAIQQALERIFEMGRYRNTTLEIAIPDADFIYDATLKETFVYFPRATYSAAIAFRNDERGWNVVNQATLYREGRRIGDYKFVNMDEVQHSGSTHLKYRCPVEQWTVAEGPFFAMMKLEAPILEDDDIVPITTIGALQHAVQAVSYEYLSDDTAAEASWQRFELAMMRDEPQSDGPVNQVGTPEGF